MKKHVLPVILAVVMVFGGAFSAGPAAAREKPGVPALSEEGAYVPHEAVVLFRRGGVRDGNDTLKAVRAMDEIGDGYGESMRATGEAADAAEDARAEISILRRALGGDFTLLDSIAFTDDLTVARVRSEAYDTAELLERLCGDPAVASAEPNYLQAPNSYDYALNDPLNYYNYQANAPLARNTDGDGVGARGYAPDGALSLNAGYAWGRLTGDEEEVVVAVIDSGVNENHEELKDVLWTNPGNIGLAGEHGFNFAVDSTDLSDTIGHGTHCAGNIAAQANNGAGIAGTASGANMKLMMLSTANPVGRESEELNSYRELGAFHYVLKAKQRGVNIVAVSCSWGYPGSSEIFDEILNRLGEEGVLCFFSAGNDGADLDYEAYAPGGGASPYRVTVGAADISGKPAGFSNYGRSKVDFFAPGVNVLSSVAYKSYFPSIYDREKRSLTTAYYGLFDADTAIENGSAAPVAADCDGTVKPFGASVFRAQSEDGGTESGATCELALADHHYFSKSADPASLKVTIRDAAPGETYYLYFPYEKDPAATGLDNTDFSVYFTCEHTVGEINAIVKCGDVVADENGVCEMTGGGSEERKLDAPHDGLGFHECAGTAGNDVIIGADALDGRTVGLGFAVSTTFTEGVPTGDLHFYIDSIAVSKPGARISENESYDIMSGTSMSCPAAAGAYALIAALYPRSEGQTGAEYVRQNRAKLMSCVRKTEALDDLCISGGYLDLSLLDENGPVLSRIVCDPENDAVILFGANLNGGYTLSRQALGDHDDRLIAFPADGMTAEFSEDGGTIVIRGARSLFGTYTQFALSDGSGVRAKLCDFLVKGQTLLEPVYEQPFPQTIENSRYSVDERHLLTDDEGRALYGCDIITGVVSQYDGTRFNVITDTDLTESALRYLKSKGYSDYEVRNRFTVELMQIGQPACTNNKLYRFVTIEHMPYADAPNDEYETAYYLAEIDYTAQKPQWTFAETKEPAELFGAYGLSVSGVAGMNGRLYVFGTETFEDGSPDAAFMGSLDPATGDCRREQAPPRNLNCAVFAVRDGSLYAMFGYETVAAEGDIENIFSPAVYRFDGKAWETLTDIPYVGDNLDKQHHVTYTAKGACAAVGNGLLFLDCPVQGGGNAFLYNESKGSIEPLYETFNSYKPDPSKLFSAVETRDGVYYIKQSTDGRLVSLRMYLIPADAGLYESSYAGKPPHGEHCFCYKHDPASPFGRLIRCLCIFLCTLADFFKAAGVPAQ